MFVQTDLRIAIEAVRCHPSASASVAFNAVIPKLTFPSYGLVGILRDVRINQRIIRRVLLS